MKAQDIQDSIVVNVNLDEILVFESYVCKNEKEEKELKELEEDIEVVYPLIKIIRSEYNRVSSELDLYEGKKEKAYLKWYEDYAREHYLKYLSGLNQRQGRLFLKLITRELNRTPFQLIKEYRNGFRAVLWQGAAMLFMANLNAKYEPEKNPMIEYVMKKMDAHNIN